MKKIVLISPFPPAQNPRLLKEYECLKANNFQVKVLYAERDQWAAKFKPLNNNDFILVGGKYGSLLYYLTRLLHKLLKNVLPLAYGFDKVSWLLYLKGLSLKADLYIGHNIASLPIVVKLAKKTKRKCGFDAEDFHRNEVTNNPSRIEFINAKELEDQFINQIDYFTTASPLISEAYSRLYPNLNPITINNVFPIQYLAKSKNEQLQIPKSLKLFWFSQTIGRDRGLEIVLEAMSLLKSEHITLTLMGYIAENDKSYFEKLNIENGLSQHQLIFIPPVAPNNIFEIAAQNDIGLALEINVPYNRDICLTNKIFTYVTAGLGIIATATKAQKLFLEQYPNIGKMFTIGDKNQLVEILKNYLNDDQALLQLKIHSNKLATNILNWEVESSKFLKTVNDTLKNA